MVGGLAGRGVAVEVALDAVIACAADSDGAAFHEEILVARDAVAHGGGDVEGGIFKADVFACLDAVLHVAHDVERALLGEFGVPLDVETALLRAAGGVNEAVGGAGDDLHLDALAVLDVHGSTAIDGRGVGQGESVELNGGLVRARHVELAVGGGAAEVVDDLRGEAVALRNGDVRPVLGDGEVLAGDAVSGDSSRSAAVNHADTLRLCGYCSQQQCDEKDADFLHNMDDFIVTCSISPYFFDVHCVSPMDFDCKISI